MSETEGKRFLSNPPNNPVGVEERPACHWWEGSASSVAALAQI